MTHGSLNLPSSDDNSLSYVLLKNTQDQDSKLSEVCNDANSGFYKMIFDGPRR